MEKQYFEILLESMDSKINLILEGHNVLAKEIKDTRIELKEDISLLDHKITALSNRVSSVETNLGSRIDAVETRIDSVEMRLSTRIDSVETRLSARIDSVESNLSDKIDAVHTELIDHRNNSEMHKAPRKRVIRKAA